MNMAKYAAHGAGYPWVDLSFVYVCVCVWLVCVGGTGDPCLKFLEFLKQSRRFLIYIRGDLYSLRGTRRVAGYF